MRTNISVDESLLTKAMNITGFDSKKETVENALRFLLSFTMQKDIKKLKGKLKWIGNLEQMRSDG
ncbi:MAG: type II toxin-antitoxin system VapB family antitoxin [Bacteroidetes bacterium]|nr:type II toxin-antitoxin system VapB family antitoxin [Bacteroidota bacterium]